MMKNNPIDFTSDKYAPQMSGPVVIPPANFLNEVSKLSPEESEKAYTTWQNKFLAPQCNTYMSMFSMKQSSTSSTSINQSTRTSSKSFSFQQKTVINGNNMSSMSMMRFK